MDFIKACDTFKDYKSLEEYIEDLVVCLVYSSWNYTEEQAREIVDEKMEIAREFFEEKVPAEKATAELGYFCG